MDFEPTKFSTVGEYISSLNAGAISRHLVIAKQLNKDIKTGGERYLFTFSLSGYERYGTQLGFSQLSVDPHRAVIKWDTFFPVFYLPNFRENNYIGGASHLAVMLALKNLDSCFESVPYSVVQGEDVSPLRKEQLRKILGIEAGERLPTSLLFTKYLARSLLYAEKKGFDIQSMERSIREKILD